MFSRRDALLCASAALLIPARAQSEPDLWALLEKDLPPRDQTRSGAASLLSAAEPLLAQLRKIDPSTLPTEAALEWRAAYSGLQREIAFAEALLHNAAAPERYARALACALGKNTDPRAAHAAASAEIRALQSRADLLLRGQGLRQGAVGARMGTLWRDPRYLYSDDDTGRNKAVIDMNAAMAAMAPFLAKAFGDLPLPRAEVRRMSRDDEDRRRPGYRTLPKADDIGAYYVDLSNIRARPDWTLPSVVHHELLPGHILQLAVQADARPPALRVRFAHAFGEAWAIYAEQLAAELGVFADAPCSELGYLQWRLFRMGRVLADTGMHAMGWNQERARSTLEAVQGFPVAYAGFDDDIDRIRTSPGQLAAEGLGALALARLHHRAAPHIARFHRAILTHGPWPVEVWPLVLAL